MADEIQEGEEMQIDQEQPAVARRGRGFQGSGDSQFTSRNGDNSPNQPTSSAASQAVRSIEGWIVLVTNVHEEASEEDLTDTFGEYGETQNIHLNLDRRTGYVKGYALIEYATFDEAQAAISGTNGKKLLDQVIHADFAFIRGPNEGRGKRPGGGPRVNRRGRSKSPERRNLEDRIETGGAPLESRIEA